MQPFDYTTLRAICAELRQFWLPARLEQVYQLDRYTLNLALRTLTSRDWLTICWHPQAARLGIGEAPPRTPDTFTFSDQLRHQLSGLALIAIAEVAPWERVIDLQFAQRPGDDPLWHLYVEIMGKYSNVILTDNKAQIVTVAHQVGAEQSRVRSLQTGQPYQLPPELTNFTPNLQENQQRWQQRISLIPGLLKRQLLSTYRGLSSHLVTMMLNACKIDPKQTTEELTVEDWQNLWQCWQYWLTCLETNQFQPGWTDTGYTVISYQINPPQPPISSLAPLQKGGGGVCVSPSSVKSESNCQVLIHQYYSSQIQQQQFQQLHHQLKQKISNILGKLRQKADTFEQKLAQSEQADDYRQQADLLMAYLHQWQPGMKEITLKDFTTGQPITITLNPEKNAVQNAQGYYKLHQKLKRAKTTVIPLLEAVTTEISYLEQIETSLNQIPHYQTKTDLETLWEIRDELIQQQYLTLTRDNPRPSNNNVSQPHIYHTASGFQIWIGRNNRQNDQLTFRTAGDYDLWFHAQEIAGSHVLLRLTPGAKPDTADLQLAADYAAYYSRGCHSEQVPVVYTEPKSVYKPKGAKPGMVVYKHERVIWGHPQAVISVISN